MGIVEVMFMMIVVGLPITVIAFFGFLVYRFKLHQSRSIAAPELRELVERVDTLQTELLSLRDDVGQLTERADFTEKLLSSGTGSRPNQ